MINTNSWSNLAFKVSKGVSPTIGNVAVGQLSGISRFLRKENGALEYRTNCGFRSRIIESIKVQLFQKTFATLNNSFASYKQQLEKKAIKAAYQTNKDTVKLITDGLASTKKIGMSINDGKKTEYAYDKYGKVVEDALLLGIKLDKDIQVTKQQGVAYNNQNTDVSFASLKSEDSYTSDTLVWNDLTPIISVQSSKNLILTKVQGRDYSRKELISGGDLNFSVTGKIVSGYADIYPEQEVAKFIQIMQYGGIVKVANPFFAQFNVSQILIKDFSCNQMEGFKDTQPYQFSCVAIEPNEAVAVAKDTINSINSQIIQAEKDSWFTALLNQKLEELKSNSVNTAASILSNSLSNVI